MDFKVTKWFERNYKLFVAIIVIALSILGLVYYINLADKTDTFIAASLYALVLFISGILLNYISNKISDKLQDRIEIYLNLERVVEFFECYAHEDLYNFDKFRQVIISFQVFTGRTEGYEEHKMPSYIKECGFSFKAKELEVENEFLDLYSSVLKSLTSIVNEHINQNHISITSRYPSVNSIFDFNPALWCKEHLSDYASDGRKMVNNLYTKLAYLHVEYSRLEMICIKLTKLYTKYLYRASLNIKQIEKLYGRKLQYTILQQCNIKEEFLSLEENLKEIGERITTQIEDHDQNIKDYVCCLEEMRLQIDNIDSSVEEIKNAISDLDDKIRF